MAEDRVGAEIEFEIGRARSGAATLSLAGRAVHSTYDPDREAETQARRLDAEAASCGASAIVLIGAGLGLLPRALRAQTARPVLIWEPFAGLRAELAPAHPCDCVVDAFAFEDALEQLDGGRSPVYLAVHPGYGDVAHFEQRFALRALRRRHGEPQLSPVERVASKRSLDALERLPGLRPLQELGRRHAGATAIIASGGPSLGAALPALRERRAGVLFAAPQALPGLLAAGVRVDYVVNPDPADLLSPVLGADAAPFGALLADTASHPAVLDRCPERTFLFHLRSAQLQGLAWERAGLPVVDEPQITVSETAFWLARSLGAQRMVLAGVDYASDDERYGAVFRARSWDGSWCTTNPVYFHGARQLAHAVREAACETRRVRSGCAVAVPGVRGIDAAELCGWLGSEAGIEWPEPTLRGTDALACAVRDLVAAPVPPAAGRAAHPDCEPWLDFAPLPHDARLAHWARLRSLFLSEAVRSSAGVHLPTRGRVEGGGCSAGSAGDARATDEPAY